MTWGHTCDLRLAAIFPILGVNLEQIEGFHYHRKHQPCA